MKKNNLYIFLFALGSLLLFSCEVEEFPNLNGADVDTIASNMSRGDLQDIAGGVQSSMRTRIGTYFDDVGVIGREFYRFSSSDPRFTSDLLGGGSSTLDNNTFYTTGPWGARYVNIKGTNIILEGIVNSTADFSTEEKNATTGFAKTIQAYELLLNLNLMYGNGIRLDVNDPDNLGPVVGKDAALQGIRDLLVSGASDLGNGGSDFPFSLTTGFAGFDTPSEFLKFNNALAARVAAYQEDYPAVLTFLNASFYNITGDLNTGVSYVFSTGAGDITNPMFFPLDASTAGVRIAQPSFVTDAEAGDTRLSKVALRPSGALTLDNLTGSYDVMVYTSNSDAIPIIRNEELLLLYAEANMNTAPVQAVLAIDAVRSGASLVPYTGGTSPSQLLTEILKQRRYSLFGEGHRWIDMRRFNKLAELPIDRAEDDVWIEFPIPLNENQ
ncbi:hypothetical protein IMCC3317_26620 [Kordia antarctica]|uniref:RagB/SusD domain-containing protein n=1 Tax=Kordia antarctica TaxID=1218801 RepID=A0A7L4ZKP7_9FLAO|nr:RagB/SusD family nutrient uptake outer membrane protein [Kordia antarctica]QHI37283.1 hypothetical protein IMCC3317_26620 [Kordia antarctica]